MPPSSAAGSASLRKLSVPTRRAVVAVAEHLVAADLVQPPPQPLDQRRPRARGSSSSPCSLNVLDARGQAGDAEHVGRAAFEEVRELARLRLAGRVAAGAALAPGAARWRAAPTYSAPVPVGPSSDLCPGNASRSMFSACTSIGSTPAVWAASTRNSTSRSRAMRPTSAIGLHGAEDVAGVRQGDQARLRRDGRCGRRRGRSVPPLSARDAGQGDAAGQFQRPQRPADAVVFQVGGDDVVAVVQDALEGHVQRVGAVEGEDEALGRLAVEELVEQVAGVVEGALGGQGHLVPGAAGVGEVVAREAVEGLVDAPRAWGNWWRRCRGRFMACRHCGRGSRSATRFGATGLSATTSGSDIGRDGIRAACSYYAGDGPRLGWV